MLVKVDKVIFPMGFVVLDMEEEQELLLILGRPFLSIGKAIIDVQAGKLTLWVNKGQVISTYIKRRNLQKKSTFVHSSIN